MRTLPAQAALAAGLIFTLVRAAAAGPDRTSPPAPLPISTAVVTPAPPAYQVVQVPPPKVIAEVPPPNAVYRDAAAAPCPPQTHGLLARFCPCRPHAVRRPACPVPAGPRVACAPAGDRDAAVRQLTAQLAAVTQAVEANTRALANHEHRLQAQDGRARSYDPPGKTFPKPFPGSQPAPAPVPMPIAPANISR